MRRLLLYPLPLAAYLGLIYFASSLSTLPGPSVSISDKVVHFCVYVGVGLLAARTAGAYGLSAWAAASAGAIFGAVYGITDEIHQSFTPGRFPEVADAVADLLGASAGAAAWLAFARRRAKAQ